MNEEILDKRLIHISSSNCEFLGNNFAMYYNLQESVKNVIYIKVMKCEVVLNPSNAINGIEIQDGDSIFVDLKKYNRLYTNINGKNVKCFEQITLNISEKFGTTVPNKLVSFKTEYTTTGCTINDTNTFVLDPMEPNLKRIDVELYDKNYNIIPKSSIKSLVLLLCIYSCRKKVTMA